ncbi:MAG: phage tail protein [Brevundimonas sp.]|uniref:phage tail protein n=1 Tax=Brevundimonas sp. TaxID=1871086 RepID=UPI00391BD89D
MSDQFIGEIRWFPYPRGVPNGWQNCDGSLLSIAEYEALYTLLGTQYGGDGVNTFGVPDLRGRLPVHQGQGPGLTQRLPAQRFGTEGVTLQSNQLGGHSHVLVASSAAATTNSPGGNLPATLASDDALYVSSTAGATPGPITNTAVQLTGGNQAHENRAPTLTLRAAIAWNGLFPTQN